MFASLCPAGGWDGEATSTPSLSNHPLPFGRDSAPFPFQTLRDTQIYGGNLLVDSRQKFTMRRVSWSKSCTLDLNLSSHLFFSVTSQRPLALGAARMVPDPSLAFDGGFLSPGERLLQAAPAAFCDFTHPPRYKILFIII